MTTLPFWFTQSDSEDPTDLESKQNQHQPRTSTSLFTNQTDRQDVSAEELTQSGRTTDMFCPKDRAGRKGSGPTG